MLIIRINKNRKSKIYSPLMDNILSNLRVEITFSIYNNNNQIQITNIKQRISKKFHQISLEEFIKILKKEELYLTNKDEYFENFLKQHDIKYSFIKICKRCLKMGRIRPITDESSYKLGNNLICSYCAEDEVKYNVCEYHHSYSACKRFMDVLHNTKDLSKVYDLKYNGIDPLDKKITLYDTICSNETEFAKVSIDEVDIPNIFKTILKRRIEYLLPVQVLALNEGLLDNKNMLVVSQTASGKTLIAELAGITKALQNKKFIYLSPLVALANQKYRYFKDSYSSLGLNVVIKVGKNKINAPDELKIIEKPVHDADIIVATYEGLDFILRSGKYDSLNDLGVVVIDEIHMLDDSERGSRLNGLINRLMSLYPQSQLIGLSATINNPHELTQNFNMKLVEYDKRPVLLERHVIGTEDNRQKMDMIVKLCENEFNNISPLGYRGQSIIFTDSRRKTSQIANQLRKKNVNAHSYHAGLTYQKKVDIELQYANQEISTVVTTAALAAGVDFPASMVIFDSLRMGRDWLTANEFHQMTGRAGRPTYQDKGKAYIFFNDENYYRHTSEEEMAYKLLESSVSDIKVKYSTNDIYEQLLADISSYGDVKKNVLKKRYYKMDSELLFGDVVDKLLHLNMACYDSSNKIYSITPYGRAVSKSFLNLHEAELIRKNITSDLLDIVTNLEYLSNVYLTDSYIKVFRENIYYVSARLFADSTKELINTPYIIHGLPEKEKKMLVKLMMDFKGDCDDVYCDCLEKNISKYIIRRRIDSLTPSEISMEFRQKYSILIYSGDIYNYLDQVIRYLEAIERIANVFGMGNVMHKCKKLIRLIEG
ncbi:DUF5814 domain-containing protein [Methanosphaera sp. BMS]|uniref:DUF5814 domain-containing protein n=1 Tax=Methanosphaera sp. BMS TaxID=1789762 RepID=UPI0013A7002A|nr:DUF5814 domain-containing protein [Methanosphaera sp. BMS]